MCACVCTYAYESEGVRVHLCGFRKHMCVCSHGSTTLLHVYIVTFCCSVPYLTSTSILPVSGALQLNTCGEREGGRGKGEIKP